MNIRITTFTNPFSFFCTTEDYKEQYNCVDQNETEVNQSFSNGVKITEFNHGQYVAVMWRKRWTRGIVSMESQLLIWLIDYGVFLRPNDKNVMIDLPLDYRKLPTKVFEASIQGVVPTDKVWTWVTDHFELDNDLTTIWTQGAIDQAHNLIKRALKTYFKPIGILSTQYNDVVLGDLFLDIEGKGTVNIIDELQRWPVFMLRNEEAYVKNFSKYYINRRRHRMCLLKPVIPDFEIPIVTLNTSFKEYSTIAAKSRDIDTFYEDESVLDDGSTVVDKTHRDKSVYKISPADIEKYSKRFITLNGIEYNVLNILTNKARDLNICNRYKDHDLKSIGRGTSYTYKNNGF